jgi:hypothetical protein
MGERRTHPALDFMGDTAQVGIMDVNYEKWIVDSTRQRMRAKDRQDLVMEPPHYIGVAGRWPAKDLQCYLSGEKGPSVGAVVQGMMRLLNHYLELRRPQEAALVACWTISTYLYPLFPAYPRLNLQGERGTGKSKLLEVIAGVAFNGLCLLDPTPAVLFRLISPLRPTLCLDEMESLGRQDKTAIFGILNAGYKSGMVVNRTEGDAGN